MAGQFAKPRTSNWETAPGGERVPSYKGDSINGFELSERKPDPDRYCGQRGEEGELLVWRVVIIT